MELCCLWNYLMEKLDFILLPICFLILYQFVKSILPARTYPPGPTGIPIFGYLTFLNAKAPYLTLTRLARQYGKIYSLKLGSVNTVVLNDPKLVKQALSTGEAFSGRAPLYLTHGIMEGKGVICAQGELWRVHRRFLSKILTTLGVQKEGAMRDILEERISKYAKGLVQDLQLNSEISFESSSSLRHFIGSFVMELCMGQSMEKDNPTWLYLQHLLDEGFKAVSIAGPLNFLPWLRFVPKYKNILGWILDGKQKTHIVYNDFWKREQDRMDPTNINSIIGAYIIEMNKLKNKENEIFNMNQINHALADFMGAGWDTALTTIKWLLLYMALYPDIQERVWSEIRRAVGTMASPKISDFKNLPFTEAVIWEMWRFRTITPIGIPHGCIEKDAEIGGYKIPYGSMIIINLWAIHTDPTLWDSPEEFRPERHLSREDGSLKRSENLLPFQIGKRMCLGETLGRWMVQLFFSTIVQNFKISFPPKTDINYWKDHLGECGLTLTPGPYQLVYSPRS